MPVDKDSAKPAEKKKVPLLLHLKIFLFFSLAVLVVLSGLMLMSNSNILRKRPVTGRLILPDKKPEETTFTKYVPEDNVLTEKKDLLEGIDKCWDEYSQDELDRSGRFYNDFVFGVQGFVSSVDNDGNVAFYDGETKNITGYKVRVTYIDNSVTPPVTSRTVEYGDLLSEGILNITNVDDFLILKDPGNYLDIYCYEN